MKKRLHLSLKSGQKDDRGTLGFLILSLVLFLILILSCIRVLQNNLADSAIIPSAFAGNNEPALPADEIRYDKVTWLCAHNAMNNAEDGWLIPNQNWSISRQLSKGVHAQMWDVWPEGDRIVLRHGPPEATPLGTSPLEDALKEVVSYLKKNPRAVITLFLESYVEAEALRTVFEQTGAAAYCYKQSTKAPWPELGTLRKSGKRLIVFTDRPDHKNTWLMSQWNHCVETPWKSTSTENMPNCYDRGKKENSLFIVNHFVTNPLPTPDQALKANSLPVLQKRFQDLKTMLGRTPQFLTVDFTDKGDCFRFLRDSESEKNSSSRHK